MLIGLGAQPQENFESSIFIYVWKQYFHLLKWHKIATYILHYNIMNIFS